MTAPPRHPPVPVLADLDAAVAALRAGVPAGAVVVHGVPVGTPPATPTVMTPTRGDTESERSLLAAARRLGTPVGYAQEHGGRVVQNIYPLPDAVDEQISTSSAVPLAFHTETAFHPHRSRYLLLLCLRGDPAAATLLCSVDAVLDRLDARTRQVLSEPRVRVGVDLSFGRGDGWLSDPAPVIGRDPDGRPTLTYDGELSVGTDAAAEAALAELGRAVADAHTAVVLAAGDLLLVDNTRAVHGRSDFRARFDGTDRWLQRTFVVDSTARITERRGDVITTTFSTAA